MIRSNRILKSSPATRVLSLIFAGVAACFCALLIFNAFRDGKPVGWQMQIVLTLAEAFFDVVIRQHDDWAQVDK